MTSHPPRTRQLELVSNWFRFSIDIGLALAIGGQGGVSTISTQLWNTNRCRFSISHPRVWFQSCCIRYRLAIDIELALAIGGYDLLVGSNQCRFPLGGRFSYRIRQQMQIQHQPYTGMVLVMLQQIQISDGYRVSISHRRVLVCQLVAINVDYHQAVYSAFRCRGRFCFHQNLYVAIALINSNQRSRFLDCRWQAYCLAHAGETVDRLWCRALNLFRRQFKFAIRQKDLGVCAY